MPVLQQDILKTLRSKTPRSKAQWIRLLALFLLLSASLVAVAEIIHIHTPAVAAASDWPTYMHDPQRSGVSSDASISSTNVGKLALQWSFKTGGVVPTSPTIVGGTAYVGSWDGYEYALDAVTGQMKWKTYLGQTVVPACNPSTAGISSTATVQNGVVYVGGGDAYWYALDASTGAILWKVFTGDNSPSGGHYNWASPLIYNGYAYIGISSVGDCPLVQGQLLKVDLATHQVVNTFNVVPNGQVGGGIWSSPTLDTTTSTIYVTTGTRDTQSQTLTEAMLAIDANTLTLKSSWAIPAAQEVLDSDFGTTPTLFSDQAGNQLVVATDKNGTAYAFKRGNLAAGPVWTQQISFGGNCPQCGDSNVSSGTFANGILYLAGEHTSINGQGYGGVVNALDPATGKFIWQHGTPYSIIPAVTYSNGLIIDEAGSMLEVLDASTGNRLYSYKTGGVLYAPASVANGEIFTGGTDSNVYAFALPTSPPPTPTPDPNCASGWSCQDIGNPTPAGSETISGATWSVMAGGTGVGGTSDQFRLIAKSVSGNVQLSAKVVSQQATSNSAQAGLMARQSSDPTSPNYAAFLTHGNGLIVQYRLAWGGVTKTAVQLATASPPLYIEIQRSGDQFTTATSSDGVTYTQVLGSTVIVPMPTAFIAGLASSSDNAGSLETATYATVATGSPIAFSSPPCPASWNCADIGYPNIAGSQSLSGGTWTMQGNGSDIWNNSDQFHFVWQSLASDGHISARVISQLNTDGNAKAGVMLRQSNAPDSAYYFAFVTPGNGIIVQYRSAQGDFAAKLTNLAGNVPTYLMVARSGTTYTTYTSSDGTNWTLVSGSNMTLNISGSVLAGLAVTSHNVNAQGLVTFDTVSVSTTPPPPPPSCPASWSCADIGAPTPAGGQSLSGSTWTIQGGGSDIWGTADQFHFVSQTLTADGSVSAHVTSQTNTNVWAKAGVMLRQSSDPGSAYYAAFVTPGNGIVVQYRTAQGASAQQSAGLTGAVPAYLMVARSGTTYAAYTSSDGYTWTAVAGSSVTLNTSGSVLAGLAVTSHNAGALSTVTFDTVNISNFVCPAGWSCGDIGAPALAGGQSLSGSTWTVQGGGYDIWGTADQFHFVSQALAADGSVSARIVSQSNTNVWAKAGVMLRQSSNPGSAYYAAFVTPSNGIVVQYRTAQGASAQQSAGFAGTVPVYLMVARSGNTYTAYTSTDGTNWTAVAGSSVTLNTSGSVLAGLAVTSHNASALSTATFDTVNVGTTVP